MLTPNPLLDKEFLKQLDLEKNKEVFVKIISLDFYENPRESIEGKATGGNITVDGKSAVRRSCSLTLVTDQVDISDYQWSLNSKFQVFIGLKNTINSIYDDIIWFKQGTFVITSFSSSYSINSYTINISGQDKMCLLNGTVGGQLPGTVDFKQEILDTVVYEEVDLGPRYILDGQTYYINNGGEYTLDAKGNLFDADAKYYRKTQTGIYEYVKINRRYYESGKYYLYTPKEDDYTIITEPYDHNSHYFIKNEDGSFSEIRFENQNYVAHTYYLYNYETNQYERTDEAYNPMLQYYEKKQYYDKTTLPIKTIIREAVHTYAEEPYYNIILNDVDDHGLYLMEYRYDEPLFLFFADGICENTTLEKNIPCYVLKDNMPLKSFESLRAVMREELAYINSEFENNNITEAEAITQRKVVIDYFVTRTMKITDGLNQTFLTTIDDDLNITYDTLVEDFNSDASYIVFPYEYGDSLAETFNIYTLAKVEYGDAAGYKQVDLIYPDDLISSIGDTLVTVLDKIKTQFNDYEYFYDIDGRFIFQRKRNYLNVSWNNIVTQEDGTFVDNTVQTSASQYNFEGNNLIISLSHTPRIENLKNDFSVWGTRKTINDVEVPIHARFAIDKKPTIYKTFPRTSFNYEKEQSELIVVTRSGLKFLEQHIYYSTDTKEYFDALEKVELNPSTGQPVDLCTMAYDEFVLEPFVFQHYNTLTNNLYAGVHLVYHYCDWRELIYQMALDYYKYNQFDDYDYFLKMFNPEFTNGKTGYEKYYIDIEGFWRQIYNPEPEVDFTFKNGRYLRKYDFDESTKTVIQKEGWEDISLDYSDLLCDFYLPSYQRDNFDTNLENVKAELLAEIDKWNSAYDSIQPLFAEEEAQLQALEKEKQEAEEERDAILKERNEDGEYRNLSNNIAEQNANIVNEKEKINNAIIEQQNNIKDTLVLFGF